MVSDEGLTKIQIYSQNHMDIKSTGIELIILSLASKNFLARDFRIIFSKKISYKIHLFRVIL